jgi:cobalt-zinc-cadmium efflux system membrane fusion protein
VKRTRLAALALLLPLAACHASGKKPLVEAARPPAGEVWLTPQQIAEGNVEVAPLETRDVEDAIFTSGTVSLDDLRTGHVFSPVTGRVVRIFAGLGQHVRKGEALAVIESPDVGNAVSDVHKAEADLLATEHDLRRRKALLLDQAGPAADVEAAGDRHRRAKAELERARRKAELLQVGGAGVTQEYTLRAPVEGDVLLRNINPGAEVQGQYSGGANAELYTVGQVDRVWVLADLYEMDVARVRVGTAAIVKVVAYPGRVFRGEVDWVGASLDSATRTAKVRCTFDNPDELLRPMMYASVELWVDQGRALAVPRSALLRLGKDKVVFVEVDEAEGRVRFAEVKVDADDGESSAWVVAKGASLAAGQKIVVKGTLLLSQMLEEENR